MDGRTTHSRFTIPTNSARRSLLEFQKRRAFSPKTCDGGACVSPKSSCLPFGAAITPAAHAPRRTLRAAVPDCWCHVTCVVSGLRNSRRRATSDFFASFPRSWIRRARSVGLGRGRRSTTESARFVGNTHQDRKQKTVNKINCSKLETTWRSPEWWRRNARQ